MKLILIFTIMLSAISLANTIRQGDTLSISIKGVPEEEQGSINGSYPVSSDGKIRLPHMTETPISASGLSPDALARKIEAAYKKAQIYTTPAISVRSAVQNRQEAKRTDESVSEYYAVIGEVSSPGPQPYRKGLTLIDVVSIAGASTFAAKNRVEVLRDGKITKYDLENQSHMLLQIRPNDRITLQKKTFWGK